MLWLVCFGAVLPIRHQGVDRILEIVWSKVRIPFGHFSGMVAHQPTDRIEVNPRMTNLLANVGPCREVLISES